MKAPPLLLLELGVTKAPVASILQLKWLPSIILSWVNNLDICGALTSIHCYYYYYCIYDWDASKSDCGLRVPWTPSAIR
ncbi:hypothetical protein Cob_v000738 [Colletotrichum orbiculare MAFF 240422]|uniref:Uncharacterized protein n=1 Tax=Colletotrichum orbiculare (strain 104-T / ATCC 96160 / CBS 514.97 / LARS 414 / MAFF 240422) TaxID=1213857 RepID=A0A484G501_COLOR|nr:hypothetical protein Cob_v000738 [Colletotrichum orbiculare MAFF 240422]